MLQPVFEASAVLSATENDDDDNDNDDYNNTINNRVKLNNLPFVTSLPSEFNRGTALNRTKAVENEVRVVFKRLFRPKPLLEDFVLEQQRLLHLANYTTYSCHRFN